MLKEFLESGAGILAVLGVYLIEKVIAIISKRKEARKIARQRMEEEQKQQARERKASYEFTNEIDRKVKHVLTGFLSALRPLRTFVIHFHNGTYTDAGVSLPKMTILHEIKERYSVLPIADTHQEIPVPEFMKPAFNRVRMLDTYYIKDRDEVGRSESSDYNPPFNQWLIYYDVRSMYLTAIHDNRTGRVVACLVLQFRSTHTLNEQDIVEINEQKKRIEAIYGTIPA